MSDAMIICATCGFLSLRHRWDRTLVEAEPEYRNSATIPPTTGQLDNHERIPICFALAIEFRKEISRDDASGILPVINKPRSCDSFIAWKHGFSPKEHQEMLDRQWMLDFQANREDAFRQWHDQSDKQWRDAQARAEREWREKQASDDKAWREQQAQDERDWREGQAAKEERRHIVNLVVYGLLAIIAGITGAAIQASWIPNILARLFSYVPGTT